MKNNFHKNDSGNVKIMHIGSESTPFVPLIDKRAPHPGLSVQICQVSNHHGDILPLQDKIKIKPFSD